MNASDERTFLVLLGVCLAAVAAAALVAALMAGHPCEQICGSRGVQSETLADGVRTCVCRP